MLLNKDFLHIKQIILLCLISSVVVFSGCQTTKKDTALTAPTAAGELDCSVLKVGQADAMILTTQNHTVIIDCGEEDDGDEVVKFLSERNIDFIDYLFVTHFDKDHVGGVPEVLDNIAVGKIITPNYQGENDEYDSYIEKMNELELTANVLTEDLSFILDDVLFEIYPPQRNSYTEGDNDFSLAISVTHGENRLLFTGDAEADRISEIIQSCGKEYAFLKVPHHGKYNKNTNKLIDTVKPSYAVITDSEKNPAEEKVVYALEKVGCNVYYTKNGDINLLSNGRTIEIKQ